MKNRSIEVSIRAQAFSCEGVKTHRVSVEMGTVRVWDSTAGHFTTCHILSSEAVNLAKVNAARKMLSELTDNGMDFAEATLRAKMEVGI